ncbi:hypothetical protein SULPSESMR1_00724 [Pseudosulfitobacter pseudonitzschiae]|uniref:Uncharacterized protein n=1 Tax=Pseudosulfitobacter pseudonitzschiae TaxID=1402135 RepID=A0A221JXT9_9RHOB|nr:hypothetical protein SULPSESMR1_00724 [Pseudosulfitobacter pseudonitzschiae]
MGSIPTFAAIYANGHLPFCTCDLGQRCDIKVGFV